MKLNKIEEDHIKIWRLLREVSAKHSEGYYSLDITPNEINNKYYLPSKGHKKFESADEVIESLTNLLQMGTIEYKMDLQKIVESLAKAKQDKKDNQSRINELENKYQEIIKTFKK